MNNNQRITLKTDDKNINWWSMLVSSIVYSTIISVLVSFIFPVYLLIIAKLYPLFHIKSSVIRDWYVLIFALSFFVISIILCGIIEYVRHKNLKSAMIVTLLTFFLGGGIAIIMSIIILVIFLAVMSYGQPPADHT